MRFLDVVLRTAAFTSSFWVLHAHAQPPLSISEPPDFPQVAGFPVPGPFTPLGPGINTISGETGVDTGVVTGNQQDIDDFQFEVPPDHTLIRFALTRGASASSGTVNDPTLDATILDPFFNSAIDQGFVVPDATTAPGDSVSQSVSVGPGQYLLTIDTANSSIGPTSAFSIEYTILLEVRPDSVAAPEADPVPVPTTPIWSLLLLCGGLVLLKRKVG